VNHEHILQLLDKYDAVNYPSRKALHVRREVRLSEARFATLRSLQSIAHSSVLCALCPCTQVTALVLELAPAGELFDFIRHTGKLDEDVARTYFTHVIIRNMTL
jgi:serine/threonine protein kinase